MTNAYLQYNKTYALPLIKKANWCNHFIHNYSCATSNGWKSEYYSNTMITNKPAGYDESTVGTYLYKFLKSNNDPKRNQ